MINSKRLNQESVEKLRKNYNQWEKANIANNSFGIARAAVKLAGITSEAGALTGAMLAGLL